MKKFLFVASVTFAITACNSSSEKTASSTTDTNQTSTNTVTPIQPQPVVTPASTTAAGMNPEHGKPGHRCDIPVGAPLSTPVSDPKTSPTVTPTAPTVTTSPVIQPSTNTTTPATTAPGMNPAHGQPGHRCDIPVGSPLNSKPAPAISTTPVKSN